jgi:hypothetical protein
VAIAAAAASESRQRAAGTEAEAEIFTDRRRFSRRDGGSVPSITLLVMAV